VTKIKKKREKRFFTSMVVCTSVKTTNFIKKFITKASFYYK